jgi:hypothetical protein
MYLAMNIKIKTGTLFIFLIYFSVGLISQNLPEMHLKVLTNDTVHFQLKAYLPPSDNLYGPNHGDINQLTEIGNEGNLKIYDVVYTPDSNFVGRDTAIIEYRGYPGISIFTWKIKKVIVYLEVLNSIIEATNDYLFTEINSVGDTIDVLANDHTTASNLTLTQVFNARNCSAAITSDNKLFVIPNNDFEGIAYLNYTIEDEIGSSATGNLMLKINQPIPDTIEYYVTNANYLSFVLDSEDYILTSNEPELGNLDLSNDPEIIYTPHIDSIGLDTFELTNGIRNIFIKVKVLENESDGNMVIDDKVFTSLGHTVEFNVSTNDLKKNSFITAFTQPEHGTLTHLGQGIFTYTPDAGFNGYDKFNYTRHVNFNQYETAKVKIVVDNFFPYNDSNYEINIPKNKQFVLNYNIPLDSYTFELYSPLTHGSVEFFEGYQTVLVNCEDISGKNLIVYTPEENFIGSELMELQYCTPNNQCNIIKIDFNIVDEAGELACYCSAYECIWEGDTDNNGIVNVKDILPIGRFAGNSGSARNEFSNNWLGLNGTNWENETGIANFDLKHVDSDGDGNITDTDSLSIVGNYNKLHNLYFNGEIEQSKFPIYISTDQTEVDSGEVLILYINAGDEQYVAKDITGLSYILQIEPEFVDSASLHHLFYMDSWLVGTGASMQMSDQVYTGQVEAAISKVGDHKVSGVGKIGRCDFIIEDDFIGGHISNGNYLVPIKIRLTNVNAITANGETINIPDSETYVYLRLKQGGEQKNTVNINLYPNPANEKIVVFAEGTDNISSYKIYNLHGKLMAESRLNAQKQTEIITSNYNTGIYIIEVETDNGYRVSKKIEIIK